MNRIKTRKSLLVLMTVMGVLLLSQVALAIPGGLQKVQQKAGEIQTFLQALAVIIVTIGAIWSGLKFVKGDQDAWGYVWKFALGGVIVFASSEIATWLQA